MNQLVIQGITDDHMDESLETHPYDLKKRQLK